MSALATDVLGSIAVVIGVAVLGWLLASALTKDPARRAIVSLMAVLWSLLFESVSIITRDQLGSAVAVLLVWTLLGVLAVLVVLRASTDLSRVAGAINVAGWLLLAMSVFTVVQKLPKRTRAIPWEDARTADKPDIYIIIPDKYSGREWLEREYGVDHRGFEDSLKSLGFTIPATSRANYAHTKLALPTFLTGQYVALPGEGEAQPSHDELTQAFRSAPLWTTLRDRGYRVVYFGTTYEGTAAVDSVNLSPVPPTRSRPALAETWWIHSPVPTLAAWWCAKRDCEKPIRAPFPVEPIEALEWKLTTLATLPDSTGPVAAVIHLIAPHEPYLYTDACEAREPWWPWAEEEAPAYDDLKRAYAAQVRCLDRLLLRTVTELIARGGPNTVVLIQSDHGRGLVSDEILTAALEGNDAFAKQQFAERFSLFAAYRFPGADTLMYDGITPVNVLPSLWHAIFATPLVRQADRTFWSKYATPSEVTEVNPQLLIQFGAVK